jgi:g-D-glutamyl-meso-diaminopimelate peptidase
MKGIGFGVMIMICWLAAWGASLKSTGKPYVSRVPVMETPRFSACDSIPPDTIVPPKYDFLTNDSLIAHYVIEDTAKYTYDMIREDLKFLQRKYPAFVHPVAMGKSEFGLELSTVRIGRAVPKKRCVYLVGNVHAREDYSSKLLMKFLNVYLLAIDGKSPLYPNARAWLDSIDVYITPVANPDGLKIAHEDWIGIRDSFDLVKDSIILEDSYREWKANGRGVDINTTFDDGNYAVKKGGAFHDRPASEGYKGTAPAQPLETQCLQRFVQQNRPLITASFHTKGNILFWADAKTHPIFRNVDTEIVTKAAAASGFRVSSISKNPADYGCGLENYVRSRLGLIGTCVELSRGDKTRFQHPDNRFNQEVWAKAWKLPYLYIENALLYADRIEAYSKTYLDSLPR